MTRRNGTVMMRTKGNAREAAVDLTTHRAAMQPSWMRVNMFMRHVFTCRQEKGIQRLTPGLSASTKDFKGVAPDFGSILWTRTALPAIPFQNPQLTLTSNQSILTQRKYSPYLLNQRIDSLTLTLTQE